MQRGRSSCTRRGALIVGIVLLLLAALVPTAGAAGASSGGGDRVPGISNHTLGSLSAAWWKYVLAQPAATNPLSDLSGAGCQTGQAGPVFFLVGSADTKPVKRTACTVPNGRSLFFPMINTVNIKTEDGETAKDLWNQVHDNGGFTVTRLYATIDGVRLVDARRPDPRYRGCVGPDRSCPSSSFVVFLPKDSLFEAYAPGPQRTLAVADGYYVLMPPLRPGKHVVSFGGEGADGFTQSITYVLTVR